MSALYPCAALAAGLVGALSAGLAGARAGAARLLALAAVSAALLLLARGGGGLGPGWQALSLAGALPLLLLLKAEDEAPLLLAMGAALGMGLIAAGDHLFMLFIGLEMMSISLYLLIQRAGGRRAGEAAVKYFFSGALAASLYLAGMTLRYYASWSMGLEAHAASPAAALGQALMLCAALFKIGSFPFHFWLPDAYEAASSELAGFMSTSVKAAGFLLLLRVLALAPAGASPLVAALPWAAGLTATAANLLALRQKSLARLLAYSSMSHAGYLLAAVWAYERLGRTDASTVFVYLAVYLFVSTGAFLFLRLSGVSSVSQLKGFSSRAPLLAAFLALMLLSLAGVPPTAGFLSKFLLFWDLARAGGFVLALVLALNSLVGLGYYLNLVRAAFLEPAGPETAPAPAGAAWRDRLLLASCAAPALCLGVAPRAVWGWARAALGI